MEAMHKRLSYFANVTESDVQQFLRVPHRVLDVAPNTEIVELGEEVQTVFIVEAGWAIRFRTLDDGRRQIVNFMLPGDCFDLQAVVHAKSDHAVMSVTEMRLRVTSVERFMAAVRENAEMAVAFWWASIQEEAILREQIIRNGRRSARERIAHLVLELHRRLCIAGVECSETMRLPVTRDMLADALGLTSIHVSRTLSQLKRDRLLDTSRRQARILDRRGLAKAADFDPSYLHVRRDGGAEPDTSATAA